MDWKPAARAENLHYALGWLTADVRGERLVYHNGENSGFRAAIVLAPSSKAGVVVLKNGESKPFIEMTTRSFSNSFSSRNPGEARDLADRSVEAKTAGLAQALFAVTAR